MDEEKIEAWEKDFIKLLNRAAKDNVSSWRIEAMLRDHLAIIETNRKNWAASIIAQQPALNRLIDAGIEI